MVTLFLPLALAASLAVAQPVCPPPPPDAVTLVTGETLRGVIKSSSEEVVVLVHPVLGELVIPRAKIAPPPVPSEPIPAPPPAPTPPAAAPTPPASPLDALSASDDKPFYRGWSFDAQLGVNGSTGQSDTINGRLFLGGKRTTTRMETGASAEYVGTRDNGATTRSRADINLKNDWLLKNSPWRLFAKGRTEYDQFEDWDWRLSAYAGTGYQFIHTEKTQLIARAGLGGAWTFGSSDDHFRPEGNLGLDLSHQLTRRTSLTGNFDYYPSFENLSDFRTVTRAGLKIDVDPDLKLYLKLGAEHRYDSSTGPGVNEHALDYFALVGWSF